MKNYKFDLNERLIDFAVNILNITDNLYNTRAGNHLAGQLVRSCTSPALQYGEAMSAESTNDFIHKFKILLKELRETLNGLKLVQKIPLTKEEEKVKNGLRECNELIAIFVKSIETTKSNALLKKSK